MTADQDQAPPDVTPIAEVTPLPTKNPAQEDLDRILPEMGKVILSDGNTYDVHSLKTREFLSMMRIITRGGANVLSNVAMNLSGSVDAFVQSLLAVTLFAVPEAPEETIDFVRSMVSGADDEENEKLDALLKDPELDDTFSVIEAVVRREAPDLKALGNRLAKMFQLATKVGAVKLPASSSEGSAAPSTSSPASTAGTTTSSST